MAMGMATTRLGLGATCSTTYYEPFHVARLFVTVDQLSGGRAGWNVVTSLNDGEAFNMGRAEVMEHDLRYDRADEFMEVVLGHWDSWDDDALILDKHTGRFGDGTKGAAAGLRGTISFARAGHSPCRGRRRAIRSSSRPAPAAAAAASPAAGPR